MGNGSTLVFCLNSTNMNRQEVVDSSTNLEENQSKESFLCAIYGTFCFDIKEIMCLLDYSGLPVKTI